MAEWLRHLHAWDYRYPGKRAMKAFPAGAITFEPQELADYAIENGHAELTDGEGRRANAKAGKSVRRVK